jgi:hypothetical protein
VALTWYGGPWAHNYDVYFGTSANPPLVASNVNLGPSLNATMCQTWTTPALAASTTYYWKIVSKTMANLSAAGPAWSFTTSGSIGGGRTSSGAAAANVAGPLVAAPYYVMIAPSGDMITGWVSSNGANWTAVGSVSIAMGSTVDVGLAVTSHDNTRTATATFDSVQ